VRKIRQSNHISGNLSGLSAGFGIVGKKELLQETQSEPNLKNQTAGLDRWEKECYNVVDYGLKWDEVVIEHLFYHFQWGTSTHRAQRCT